MGDAQFFSFECECVPLPPGTPAAPRPADRPRDPSVAGFAEPAFYSFDCELVPLPPGTPAAARPADRPREVPAGAVEPDEAFARELAARVLEYVRNHPAGRSAEQLAALVQQFVSRRSA
jgi:hypothetical protein